MASPRKYLTNIFKMLSGCFIIEDDLTFNSDPAATALLSRHLQLEMLSLPEGLDLPPLPHLHWLSAP
ncbi:hypothetical protein FB451DRAFT_1407526 [Mycena latifolia]|nr:hypothetical protein FB451DRAFT_1407526 [Mycena latifolia]